MQSQKQSPHQLTRRQTLQATAAATLAMGAGAYAAKDHPKIKLGVIGTGGRGSWITDLFAAHGGYTIHALADYFPDRVNPVGEKHGVPSERRFTGLSGYKRLIESGVDAVAIISPPYFHPEQAAAAVDAGKHVYLAKPIAVDVPGCRSVEASGRKARSDQRVFLVDFQTRADPHFIEAVGRVHGGAMGTPMFGESMYHAGRLGLKGPNEDTPEARLRNWVFDIKLSGDIIVEQNIHTLDVMSWIMGDKPPVAVTSTRGRKKRTDVGDANDHYASLYKYPDDIGVTFSSRQCDGFGSNPAGIRNRMFGTEGVLETQYGGMILLRGGKEKFYRGVSQGIYKDGAIANIASFHDSIHSGHYNNPTIAPSVLSNLVAILGRTAAERGGEITWQQFLKTAKPIEADLSGLKS